SPCSDHTEGTLAYDCPEARRAVLTSIVTNKLTLKKLDGSKLSLWCPRCVTSTVAVSSATIAVSKGDELLLLSSLRPAWRGTGIIAKITRRRGRFWLSVITGCCRFFANGSHLTGAVVAVAPATRTPQSLPDRGGVRPGAGLNRPKSSGAWCRSWLTWVGRTK